MTEKGTINFKVVDNADELRVEVPDPFAGSVVEIVQSLWERSLAENNSRRFAIDISHLVKYDHAGFSLLHKMHLYGAYIVASTSHSLVILNEISGPLKLALAVLSNSPAPVDNSRSGTETRREASADRAHSPSSALSRK